ncbi:hypothetical protein, partial [Bifidobacterium biavatii]
PSANEHGGNGVDHNTDDIDHNTDDIGRNAAHQAMPPHAASVAGRLLRVLRQLASRYDERRWTTAFAALFGAYLLLGSIVGHMARYVPMTWGSAVIAAVCVAACLLLPALPTVGAGVLALAWSATPLVGTMDGMNGQAGNAIGWNTVAMIGANGIVAGSGPIAAIMLPPNLEYAALFAVGVAVFRVGLRCLPVPAAAIVVHACGSFVVNARAGMFAEPYAGVGFDAVGELTSTIIRFAVAAVAGYALREQMRRQATESALERNRLLLERSRMRETMATGLHDDVSNRLAFLLMVMDRHTDNGEPIGGDELRLMRDAAQEAYDTTRGMIRELGRPTTPARPAQELRTTENMTGYRWIGLIGDRLRVHDARLSESGFDGAGLSPTTETAPPAVARPVLAETLAFIDECYANIVRHADPNSPYIVAVNATAARIVVSCSDTVRTDSSGEPTQPIAAHGAADHHGNAQIPNNDGRHNYAGHDGTGLARHRALIGRLGGSLTVSADGDAWQCEAIIPYRA